MLEIAIASLKARLFPVLLVVISLTASLTLLTASDRIKMGAQKGFNKSISGVDVILGPRSGGLDLVLYTVFHIGKPTNNITTKTVDDLRSRTDIKWLVPISLGDSHRGFRVVATNANYFTHIKYGDGSPLRFSSGSAFEQRSDVVIGAEVARQLDYSIGTSIFVSHGSAESLGKTHDDFAFQVAGILKPTGTPIDRAVFMTLEGYELIHLGWQSGTQIFSLKNLDIKTIPKESLKPKTITAAYVGLSSPFEIFQFQRDMLSYPNEAISAAIPGLALAELWSLLDVVEHAFELLSWLVVAIGLISMATMTLAGLDGRNREMTIFRACGASPLFLVRLILLESILISLVAVGFAILITNGIMVLAGPFIKETYGITPDLDWLSLDEIFVFSIALTATLLASIGPALYIYRKSISQGLS